MTGCRRLEEAYESSKTGSTSISMATVRRPDGVASDEADRQIAVARCSREAACAKIRGRELRGGREQCEREVAQRLRSELAGPSCQRESLGRDALEECLGELGAEDCDVAFGPITRVSACRRNVLCGDAQR